MPATRSCTSPASLIATYTIAVSAVTALVLCAPCRTSAQGSSKTLVAVFAHGDDEVSVAPILARYAREGAQVYLIIATDGAQGGANTSIPRGPALAAARAAEARCATDALGVHPPILLAFPDGVLGSYIGDPSLLYRLTQRVQEELQRLRPDAIVTWGPDGGTGHADHRLVSSVVTQLMRAGAPGVPERLFYSLISAEGMRTMNPQRGAPPFLVPQAKHLSIRVPFAEADLKAARVAMDCHRTQYTVETVQRVFPAMGQDWKGAIPLAPSFPVAGAGTDLFN
jgi:LmbE family N-acetylglucosaminyl deacetylase